MRLLYSLGIRLYGLLLRLISPFHPKAKLWVEGRRDWYAQMKQTVVSGQKHIWFHFASLGEFEQGRAVLEHIRTSYPHKKIIVTFYSPSGYEVRKQSNLADYVFYLPEDSAKNAQLFVELIQPEFVVFTKYEYWYYYFDALKRRAIPLLMISAIFRPDQIFFQSYGGFFRKILSAVTYFFMQNEESMHLLKEHGFRNVGLTGDTRFDRVVELPKQQRKIQEVDTFVADAAVLVAGSTWPEDELILQEWLQANPNWKMILAPHEIDQAHMTGILKQFPNALQFSKFASYTAEMLEKSPVLIIDNFGMLSSLYGYGQVAYIGGGFGVGIHNTLEAATYGVPVLFGPKYQKFQEAKDLIATGAAFSIHNVKEFLQAFESLQNPTKQRQAGEQAKAYVQQNAGATAIIVKYLITQKLLS